jgi:hypothetical protein
MTRRFLFETVEKFAGWVDQIWFRMLRDSYLRLDYSPHVEKVLYKYGLMLTKTKVDDDDICTRSHVDG